jgi:hypothetical protein
LLSLAKRIAKAPKFQRVQMGRAVERKVRIAVEEGIRMAGKRRERRKRGKIVESIVMLRKKGEFIPDHLS